MIVFIAVTFYRRHSGFHSLNAFLYEKRSCLHSETTPFLHAILSIVGQVRQYTPSWNCARRTRDHRQRKAWANLRQFWTTLDNLGQFWTKCCAIMVGSRMMVLSYPLSMGFYPHNGFSLDAEQSALSLSVRHAQQKDRSVLSGMNRPLKVGARCRIMSHNVARRPSQYVL